MQLCSSCIVCRYSYEFCPGHFTAAVTDAAATAVWRLSCGLAESTHMQLMYADESSE